MTPLPLPLRFVLVVTLAIPTTVGIIWLACDKDWPKSWKFGN